MTFDDGLHFMMVDISRYLTFDDSLVVSGACLMYVCWCLEHVFRRICNCNTYMVLWSKRVERNGDVADEGQTDGRR